MSNRRRIAIAAALAAALLISLLPRLFRELSDAAVWAETTRCHAATTGQVTAVLALVGEQMRTGQPLAKISANDSASVVTAPIDGVVSRLFVTPGARINLGEPVAEFAQPVSQRVIVVLPPSTSAAVGDRVAVELLGENRHVGGTIEAVLAANSPGPWTGSGPSPQRGVILLDPSPQPPRLGQGAHIVILGRDPGALYLALFSLRRILPW